MIGINYGQEFPWDRIEKDEDVYMVDFTLQPFDLMERLNGLCNLIWIDHHKTEVEEAHRRGFIAYGGQLLVIGTGACELVWKHIMPMDPWPFAIQLLAEYDVWNHIDERTLPFQYGVRMEPDTTPTNQTFWGRLFNDEGYVRQFIIDGDLLLKYEDRQNAKFCKTYAFETALYVSIDRPAQDIVDKPSPILRAICCNRGFTNSKVFDSVYDQEKHDLMITFCRLKPPAHKWTVSLYSTKENVDCGAIARVFGGGGHKGAAEFQCKELPFEY